MEYNKNGGLMNIMYANENAKTVWRSEHYNTSDTWAKSYHEWEMVWNE